MGYVATMDIETLDTKTSGVVLSIGICFFDPDACQDFDDIVKRSFTLHFDQESQIKAGRSTSQKTAKWWSEQSVEAQVHLNPPVVTQVRDFHEYFKTFCENQDFSYSQVMSHMKWFVRGPHFDIAFMDNLFNDFNVTAPWKFYNVRDIRTWLEANGLTDNVKLVKPDTMIAHDPAHDAAFDAYMMQRVNSFDLEHLDVAENPFKRKPIDLFPKM